MRIKPLLTAALVAGLTTIMPAVHATDTQFDVFKVVRQQVPVLIEIAGTVTTEKTARLTAQMPGRVAFIAGQEGDTFNSGALLVEIDDSALKAKREAAVASREAALAAIRNANVQLQRELTSPQSAASQNAPGGMGMPSMMDQMFTQPMQSFMGMRDRGVERSSDLVARETQLAQANTQYRQAEAQIKEIDALMRDKRSIAPFAGVIETLHIEQGDTVQPGQPLVTFAGTGGYQVRADIPVRLRPGLREGDTLGIQLDGSGPMIGAPISRIFPVADPNQHTVRMELDLPRGTAATAGQYAVVSVPDLQARQTSKLLIPESAIVTKGGLPLVFKVGSAGAAQLRVVRLGESTGSGYAIVLAGVQEGDRVVNNPPPGLRSGTPVTAPQAD